MNLGEERPFNSSVFIIPNVISPLLFCASPGFELMMLKLQRRFLFKSILHDDYQLKAGNSLMEMMLSHKSINFQFIACCFERELKAIFLSLILIIYCLYGLNIIQ